MIRPLRVLLAFSFLGLSSLAQADEATDAAFQAAVTQAAAHDERWIEAWGTANLDGDPALERVALLCSTTGERRGFWIVEKDPQHRWELSFDVDSRTRACQKKPDAVPKWEARTAKVVEVYQGHVEGHEQTSYALRADRLVIVREEENTGKHGAKTKLTDWDQIIKGKKKGAVYQHSDRVQELPAR